jgi:hypothetical protein
MSHQHLDIATNVVFFVAIGLAFYWCARCRAAEAKLTVTEEQLTRAVDNEVDQSRRLDDAHSTLRLIYSRGEKQ